MNESNVRPRPGFVRVMFGTSGSLCLALLLGGFAPFSGRAAGLLALCSSLLCVSSILALAPCVATSGESHAPWRRRISGGRWLGAGFTASCSYGVGFAPRLSALAVMLGMLLATAGFSYDRASGRSTVPGMILCFTAMAAAVAMLAVLR